MVANKQQQYLYKVTNMVEVPPQIAEYVKKIDDGMAKYPSLTQYEKMKELETKTGYSKVYFFLAITLVLSINICCWWFEINF